GVRRDACGARLAGVRVGALARAPGGAVVRGTAEAVGGGADVRVARGVPPALEGLRAAAGRERGDGAAQRDPADGPAPHGESPNGLSAVRVGKPKQHKVDRGPQLPPPVLEALSEAMASRTVPLA